MKARESLTASVANGRLDEIIKDKEMVEVHASFIGGNAGIHLKMLKYHFWTRHIQWCLVRFGNVSHRLVNGCMDMFNPVLSKSIFF